MSNAMETRTDVSIAKLVSARAAHGQLHEATPAALAAIQTAAASSKSYNLPLVCRYSGITVGSINVISMAGRLPMIANWKESQTLHPLFSLKPVALLQFSRNTWSRFCSFSVDESLDDSLTFKQEQTLRVAALAMLHHLADVRQDIEWLPSWKDVVTNWSSLLAVSYWKAYLESERFRFPSLHISRWEEPDLTGYLQACWEVKKNYETVVSSRIEKAKLEIAERAMIAIRNDIAGKSPRSSKLLWRWFVANMPARYEADLEGWMQTIWNAKGDSILKFTLADVDLFEEIFLCECPTGSTVSHAFLDVLRARRSYLADYFSGFEIIIPQALQAEIATGSISEIEPVASSYPTRGAFLVAQAKWKIAHGNVLKQMKTASDKQAATTVKASFIPRFELYAGEELEQEPIDDNGIVLDAFTRAEQEAQG